MAKPREKGRNIVGQQLPTLLDVTCSVRLHTLLHVVACSWELLIVQSLKSDKLSVSCVQKNARTPKNCWL